jgi:adenylate cyclase
MSRSDSDVLTDAEIGARIRRRVTFRLILANALGAAAVFIYLSLVAVGSTGFRSAADLLLSGVTAVYLAVAVPLSAIRARRRADRTRDWFVSGREPTDEERLHALKLPGALATQIVMFWIVAAMILTVLNVVVVKASPGRAIQIASTIVLGGLITGAIGYLLIERIQRPISARALANTRLRRPATAGVRIRLLLAWLLGSAAILLGIILTPLGALPGEHPDISGPVIFLAIVGLWAGAALTINAARSIADPLESVRDGLRRVQEGDIEAEVTVDDGGDLGLLQAGFNEMVKGLRERQRLQELFGRHVGTDVARRALERDGLLGGSVRDVSTLFVDVIGSTGMAQRRSPEDVVATLNALFSTVVRVAEAEGGWVNKFEGDAALCIFGAPEEQPDHPARALRAARALRRELKQVAAERPDLDAGIGVSSGKAVAGNIGAEQRYEYTVIGDPVNEAARLSEAAKTRAARVLASGAAVERAGAEAAYWESVGEETLRGRSAPTVLYEPRG